MLEHVHSGPSGIADWERSTVQAGAGPRVGLLIIPDAASPGLSYYLPEIPSLVRDADGRPSFSLTLLLGRAPEPGEEAIEELVRQGLASFDVTLAVPAGVEEELSRQRETLYRPLFARDAVFTLERAGAPLPGARVTASGTDARAALSLSLEREDALAVLAALDSAPSGLTLRARVRFRAAFAERTVRLEGTWAAVHDFLAARVSAEGLRSLAELRQDFEDMLREKVLIVSGSDGGVLALEGWGPHEAELFGVFRPLASVVLRRQTPELELEDPENQYALRGRPDPRFPLSVQLTLAGEQESSIDLSAPLERVLGGALAGLSRDLFIHLVSPGPLDGDGVMLGPAPRRITLSRSSSRAARRPGQAAAVTHLAVSGGTVASLATASRPDPAIKVSAASLAVSDLATPAVSRPRLKQWALDDLVLVRPRPTELQSLPVIDSLEAPLWPDRLDARRLWYAPSLELVEPHPGGDPAESPFLFTFQRTGVTVEGRPALEGSARITLRLGVPPEVKAALEGRGNPPARRLPARSLSGTLDVPFVDQADGLTKHHALTAEVRQDGDTVTLTFSLLNEWVRLCYGALSQPGFQREPARVRLTYSYEAYTPVRREEMSWAYGIKVARIPLAYSRADVPEVVERPVVDATGPAVLLPTGELHFKREPAQPGGLPPPAATAPAPATERRASGALRPAATVRPELALSPAALEVLRRREYARQTLVREEQVDVLFPCNALGALYLQSAATGSTAVGCDDALRLGETRYQQYERLSELAHPRYAVYRSLQQPGRFLVLPAEHLITRFDPAVGQRAYRPVVFVYASVDPAVPANNRVILHAVLQPDLAPYLRRALEARLGAYARHPVIEYPNEIESEPSYTWVLGGGAGRPLEPQVVKLPDSFQVSLTTDPTGIRLLLEMLRATGISGAVRFRLPDGSTLESALRMDLGHITGPWRTGPLEVVLAEGQVQLTNRVSRPVAVSDLALHVPGDEARTVPVETTLDPGASIAISLPSAAGQLYPVYTLPPAAPITVEEIRSFAEDVQTNVVFVNLINFDNHGLERLDLVARLAGMEEAYPVSLTADTPVAAIDLSLPLTTYLEERVLQFQVTRRMQDGTAGSSGWLVWDLEAQGNVVSLQWELIAAGAS